MWELINSVPKKEQGIILLLDALESNAKAGKAVADIKANELNVENGLIHITYKFHKIFLQETADEAYKVYSDFINYSKTVEMTVSEYVLEFERSYKRMIEHEMILPDPVLTFKLLDGANITNDERKPALTFCVDLKYEKMKSALKRHFASPVPQNQNHEMEIKQEEIFWNKKLRKQRLYNEQSKRNENNINPLDKHGKISRCKICDSKLHSANKCPHKYDQNINVVEDQESDTEEVNIILMTENITNEEILVLEASKSAVIDTACTKTVAGEQWFVNYKSNLTADSIKNIKIFQSNTKFKLGDGEQVSAVKKVIFPAKIAEKYVKQKQKQ